MRIKQGMIVKSDAGHDQNRYYIVVAMERDFAFIADGKRRKVERPKKKSFKHLKPTNRVLEIELYQTNKQIRKALFELNNKEEACLKD